MTDGCVPSRVFVRAHVRWGKVGRYEAIKQILIETAPPKK